MNFKIPIYETNIIVELWNNSVLLNKRYKEILQKAKVIDEREGLAEALVLFSPLGKNEIYLLISKKRFRLCFNCSRMYSYSNRSFSF